MRWVVVAGAVALASGAVAQQRAAPVVVVTERDSFRPIRLPVGGEIRARLTQQAGTPYSWQMQNNAHLRLLGSPALLTLPSNGRVGGPQVKVFRLRVVKPGRYRLVFGLRSAALGPDQTPAQRLVLNVDSPAVVPPSAANEPAWKLLTQGVHRP